MIFIIIWFDIASEEIELNANPFNPFFMSGGSGNANNNGWGAQGHVGFGNNRGYGAIYVGRDAGWNGSGSNSVGISGGFRF